MGGFAGRRESAWGWRAVHHGASGVVQPRSPVDQGEGPSGEVARVGMRSRGLEWGGLFVRPLLDLKHSEKSA